ncbi:AcrR family transcriptional regulator [Rhizobium leguminosarum]|uniref:AcrR family transcriptional regulator n=1 Tax=Rhizobium leguminosarum TaxID=384 RepID=A0A7Z0DXF5_RHILE|nr:TetR/AcrR family transcriptional regulator [Rhizobium leguminosarum]NYJ10996.1 AcrR family transcriptional regulator [Rhizobium leguminosarum]
MKEREEAICEAAARMFIRYGVKRTGMNDIAREAGIARQTLYNLFPNKETVLSATIRLVLDRELRQAESELASCSDLRDQLGIVFDHLARRPYAMLHSTPNAADIVEGVSEESRKVIGEWRDNFRSVVERLLAPVNSNLILSGITPHQLADAVVNFASLSKYEARDHAHLDELLLSLTKMAVRCAT